MEIRDWSAADPRVQVHFTPTSASWMNLVEVWFGIIEREAIRRGSFGAARTPFNGPDWPPTPTGRRHRFPYPEGTAP
jgi:hypothetical protein